MRPPRELMPCRAMGTGFHAIDTSNVMDYCGAWNVVLACAPCLADSGDAAAPSTPTMTMTTTKGGAAAAAPAAEGAPAFVPFVFTEQILGVASSVDDMLREVLPYDPVRVLCG